jgi:hypothetical protein
VAEEDEPDRKQMDHMNPRTLQVSGEMPVTFSDDLRADVLNLHLATHTTSSLSRQPHPYHPQHPNNPKNHNSYTLSSAPSPSNTAS